MYQDAHFSLLFRPLREENAAIIHEAVLSSLTQLQQFMYWAHQEQSVEHQLHRINQSQQDYAAGIAYEFSVFDQKTQAFLMSAKLSPSRTLNKQALNIGYWTSSAHTNKGLATLVTKILTVIAFEYLQSDRVELSCNKANLASVKVIEKCLFRFEGETRNYFSEPTQAMKNCGHHTQRNCLHYALIREDLKQIAWFETIKNCLTFY